VKPRLVIAITDRSLREIGAVHAIPIRDTLGTAIDVFEGAVHVDAEPHRVVGRNGVVCDVGHDGRGRDHRVDRRLVDVLEAWLAALRGAE
jgi:hypothetical protein